MNYYLIEFEAEDMGGFIRKYELLVKAVSVDDAVSKIKNKYTRVTDVLNKTLE